MHYTKYNRVSFCPTACLRSAASRPVSSPAGNQPGRVPSGSRSLARGPWPARSQIRKNRVSFTGYPVPLSRAKQGNVKPGRRSNTTGLGTEANTRGHSNRFPRRTQTSHCPRIFTRHILVLTTLAKYARNMKTVLYIRRL